MLEQVQRGAAAAVEQVDVLGLDCHRRQRGQAVDQRVHLGQAGGDERTFLAQRIAQFGQVRAQLGVGVAQEVRQHAQRAAHRRGGRQCQHGFLRPPP
jgi:hypothetical protein